MSNAFMLIELLNQSFKNFTKNKMTDKKYVLIVFMSCCPLFPSKTLKDALKIVKDFYTFDTITILGDDNDLKDLIMKSFREIPLKFAQNRYFEERNLNFIVNETAV